MKGYGFQGYCGHCGIGIYHPKDKPYNGSDLVDEKKQKHFDANARCILRGELTEELIDMLTENKKENGEIIRTISFEDL